MLVFAINFCFWWLLWILNHLSNHKEHFFKNSRNVSVYGALRIVEARLYGKNKSEITYTVRKPFHEKTKNVFYNFLFIVRKWVVIKTHVLLQEDSVRASTMTIYTMMSPTIMASPMTITVVCATSWKMELRRKYVDK